MPQQPKRKPKLDREALLSPTGAAELFHRDRATLKRALRNVEPDAFEGGQPRFKLSTILEAMEDHNRTTGRSRSAAAASPIEAELGALEQADLKFKAFL